MLKKSQTLDCSAFADLLEYPSELIRRTVTDDIQASDLPKQARKHLEAFLNATEKMSLDEFRELHTRTFDLSPLCSPALSVHLFGVESFKRSHLMVGLMDQYRASGFSASSETADNMVTVLRYLGVAPAEERGEMLQHIILPAFKKMADLLKTKSNPYGDALRAAEITLASETGKEHSYA